jgi:hypothetical protein
MHRIHRHRLPVHHLTGPLHIPPMLPRPLVNPLPRPQTDIFYTFSMLSAAVALYERALSNPRSSYRRSGITTSTAHHATCETHPPATLKPPAAKTALFRLQDCTALRKPQPAKYTPRCSPHPTRSLAAFYYVHRTHIGWCFFSVFARHLSSMYDVVYTAR